MKTLILDGSLVNNPMGAQVASALHADLAARNWTSETIFLRGRFFLPDSQAWRLQYR